MLTPRPGYPASSLVRRLARDGWTLSGSSGIFGGASSPIRCALTPGDAHETERYALSYRASFVLGTKIMTTTDDRRPPGLDPGVAVTPEGWRAPQFSGRHRSRGV